MVQLRYSSGWLYRLWRNVCLIVLELQSVHVKISLFFFLPQAKFRKCILSTRAEGVNKINVCNLICNWLTFGIFFIIIYCKQSAQAVSQPKQKYNLAVVHHQARSNILVCWTNHRRLSTKTLFQLVDSLDNLSYLVIAKICLPLQFALKYRASFFLQLRWCSGGWERLGEVGWIEQVKNKWWRKTSHYNETNQEIKKILIKITKISLKLLHSTFIPFFLLTWEQHHFRWWWKKTVQQNLYNFLWTIASCGHHNDKGLSRRSFFLFLKQQTDYFWSSCVVTFKNVIYVSIIIKFNFSSKKNQ